MSDGNTTIFNQFQKVDDTQLMGIFEKSEEEVSKLIDDVFRTAGNVGAEFDLLYCSLTKIEAFITNMYRSYLIYCKQKDKKPVLSIALRDFKVTQFDEAAVSAASYFGEIRKVDRVTRNTYILSSKKIALYHIKEATKMYFEIDGKSEELKNELENAMRFVVYPQGENLFAIFMGLLKESANRPNDMQVIMGQTVRIIDFAKGIKNELSDAGINIICETDECNSIYESFAGFFNATKSIDERVKDSIGISVQYGLTEPEDMLNKLLKFSESDDKFKSEFVDSLHSFNNLPDKKGSDDVSRNVRRNMTNKFYELYEKVFLRAVKEEANGIVIELFLNYGIVDDTMFSRETLEEIISLSHSGEVKNAHIYTSSQWLEAIYSGKKQPSRNDLDMDYTAYVLDMERRGDISSEQKEEYLNNCDLKVNYEIKNFIRMNSRLTNGELSVFCPVLTEEDFIGTPKQMFVQDDMISDAIEWLLSVDYSVFHREQMYDDRENGISNMLINVQVFPDIILMPVTGIHSRMWQEIDGKKRNTPGRFTFPAFTKQDLKDMITQSAGSFRWQLCKKIQGNYWNIVSEKSLTSEYYDYIQFYKKNRDLSEQAKDKITTQLQRARNNFAECFAMDYAVWVKNEVIGSVRLNKLVREIMATYCAPSKSFRENLKTQPMFAEAFARYEREKAKKVKEINNRRAAIRNANGEETPEFTEEARFWEEM